MPDLELLAGWGRTAATAASVARPTDAGDVAEALTEADGRGAVPRGLGRAYNDAAQCAGGTVVDCTGLTGVRALDADAGTVTVHAGTSLDDLIRWVVPLGFFVPVTPGTRQVTVGGAIAADVHGKNHHRAGTFAEHVRSMRLQLSNGEIRTLTPDGTPEEFWATAGGMGLTGVVLDATVALPRIETSRLRVDTERANDLDDVMARMAERDADYHYSVAWIDLMARGASMGRSVLTRGDFARREDLPARARRAPLVDTGRTLLSAPSWVPPGLLNRLTISAFNEVWFRKAPKHREGQLQSIGAFFYPLDMVAAWNRLYGARGMVQWQCVVPFGEEATLRRVVEKLSAARCPSFLAVLKRFGAANPGPLSFPSPGWTLALDIPAAVDGLGPLLDDLDGDVVAAGGRLYLAKDARFRADLLPAMYPRLEEWRRARDRLDPDRVLDSDLARRLALR